MELSVIIPCLNGGATLSTQLDALAAQKWSKPWELIISDNGSTDNSMEIARRYKEHFQDFRIIDSSDKMRQSHALNVAVRAAKAEKVAFCDADDEVAPGWVAAIGDALSKHDVVHGQFYFDKFNEPNHAEAVAKEWKNGLCQKLFLPGGGAGNLGIWRWAHDAIGGFDECIPRFEDSDYYWKLQLEGFELHYAPEAIVQVRIGRVKPSFSYLYRRHRTMAAGKQFLYKRYRPLGMRPHPPFRKSLAAWLGVFRKAKVCIRSKRQRDAWLLEFAQTTGYLMGEIQGRATNPCKPYLPGEKSSDRHKPRLNV